MPPRKKKVKKVQKVKKAARTRERVETSKTNINKLNARQVGKLKGKLVEVRRAGASPIFVEVERRDTILKCLIKADVPVEDVELKIEALREGARRWAPVTEDDKAIEYQKIVVTTKVRGSLI